MHAGCRGTVLAEFSDTRLTVVFETSETGTPSCFNVLPLLSWNLAVSFFSFLQNVGENVDLFLEHHGGCLFKAYT